jgi:hypothetical protein
MMEEELKVQQERFGVEGPRKAETPGGGSGRERCWGWAVEASSEFSTNLKGRCVMRMREREGWGNRRLWAERKVMKAMRSWGSGILPSLAPYLHSPGPQTYPQQ